MRRAIVTFMFAAGSMVTACASTPAPRAQIASAQQAIAAAETAGAPKVPEASKYLNQAQGDLDEASRKMGKGDNETATDKAARSKADAELAAGIARAAQSTALADGAVARAQAMQAGAAQGAAVGGGPPSTLPKRQQCVPMKK
jgi:hypothetical protein